MKNIGPVIVGIIGLLLSLWFLTSGIRVIYRAWTRHGNSVSFWYYLEVAVALVGIAVLAWLVFKGRSLPPMKVWVAVIAVTVGQVIIAFCHLASFFGGFKGTPFN